MPIRYSGFIDLVQAIYLQQSLHDIYQWHTVNISSTLLHNL